MAISLKDFLGSLDDISKGFIEANEKDLDLALKQIIESAGNIKDINSPDMRTLYKKYQNIRKHFNRKQNTANRKIKELKNNLDTNKSFSNMLNENNVYSPTKGKDLTDYKNQYASKIAEQESLITNNLDDIVKQLDDAFFESGYTVNEVKTAFKEQDRIISKKIAPKLDELDKIKENMMDLTNRGFEEIDEFSKQLNVKLSADDISNTQIKKYTKEFNEWSNGYKKSEVATELIEQRKQASSIKNSLEKEINKNYIPDELMYRYNEAKDVIDNSYTDLFGDSGRMNQAAFDFNNDRISAAEKIKLKEKPVVEEVIDNAQAAVNSQQIGKEAIEESTQAAKNISQQTMTNASEDIVSSSKKVNLVKGSKEHKLKGSVIENSTAPKYKIVNNGEDELIAHLRKKNGVDLSPSDILLGKSNPNSVTIKKPKLPSDEVTNFSAKNLLKKHGLNSIINIGATLIDFKESRREGDSVLKSAAKAGVNFAIGEALGGVGTLAFYAAGSLPSLAVKTAENVSKMERQMNAATRTQPFADVHFQDTQQLATMRQSGMEMAKMAQYNLQQTLMGNEATYMHR